MHRMAARYRFPAWLLPVIVALLSACATLPGSVDVSRQQLESALARRFPYEARAGALFSVRAGAPHLALLPESNRVRLDFAVDATERLARNAAHADLSVSFGLRYEPSDASIRAVDVRLEDLALQGLPDPWRDPFRMMGSIVAEQMLEGTVLHTFRPEDFARAGGRRPGSIRVTPSGLHVELVPAGP